MERETETREILVTCWDESLGSIQDFNVVRAYIKEKYKSNAYFYRKISDKKVFIDNVTSLQMSNEEYLERIDDINDYFNWIDNIDIFSLIDYGPLVKRTSIQNEDNITEAIHQELYHNVDRENPVLIKVAKALYYWFSELKVLRIPKNIEYDIINIGETHECIVERGHYWY